ncbi:MAG: class II fructose-bisphosphate aldolase [Nitrososphaerota archaeon]|nr:class II fructose-bisphosphate aldolase [Nitrososphaerota archaeon]
MLAAMTDLLAEAKAGGFAVGSFNVYNLEGALAVVEAAERTRSPAAIQLHSPAVKSGGPPLVALCLAAARGANVPIAVHFDHGSSVGEIEEALAIGFTSIMADGSRLPYAENVEFTKKMTTLAHSKKVAVEGELGRLAGTEGDMVVPESEGSMTDPDQAASFVEQTGVDALAVCIGNSHGRSGTKDRLDFGLLARIRSAVVVPLVLHGASGVSEPSIRRCIDLGVTKFNVNAELRGAYVSALSQGLHSQPPDLAELMRSATVAVRDVVSNKLRIFRSSGRAGGMV